MTYETDGKPTKHQSSTKGANLVRVLVRVVRLTRYTIDWGGIRHTPLTGRLLRTSSLIIVRFHLNLKNILTSSTYRVAEEHDEEGP